MGLYPKQLKFFYVVTSFCLLCWSQLVQAEQLLKSGDYSIHYNAFNSAMLSPEIASQYNIERSTSLGVLNIAVLKDGNKPVTAFLHGQAKNAISQIQSLEFDQVTEGHAIYYIATFSFADKEYISFDISVAPDGEKKPVKLEFTRQFYVGK